MKARVFNKRIIVEGPGRHSPHFAAIPGARFNKKIDCWTYPASPITGARISRAAKELGSPLTHGDGMVALMREWQKMRESQHWKGDKGRAAAAKVMKDMNPFNTATQPWEHQVCAEAFAHEREAIYYAMKMGTGKTLCVIEEMLRGNPNKTLIVCPKSVIPVWPDQFHIHAPGHPFLFFPLTKGNSQQKLSSMEFGIDLAAMKGKPIIVVVNYESAFREPLGDAILSIEWDLIVLDEAHKIKAPGGKCSRWSAKLRGNKRRCLSGTPFPNTKLDGYGQWRFLDPGAFGTSFARHRALFAEMGGYHGYEVINWKNEDLFNNIIDLYMFRVDDDVLDLPESVDMYRDVPLTSRAMAAHRKLEAHFIAEFSSGEVVSAANVLARTMKLREVCSGFIIDDDGEKIQLHDEREKALEEVLDSIHEDETVVVFAEFKNDFEAIKKVAKKVKRSYGEVSGRANDLVNAKIPDTIKVLGVNPKSGSLGIDFTASHYAVFYSISYNGAEHEQAKARLHRGGQENNVSYIYLVSPNTIEPCIYQALIDKKEPIDAIMEYIKRGGSHAKT